MPLHEKHEFLRDVTSQPALFDVLVLDPFANYIIQRVLQMREVSGMFMDQIFLLLQGKVVRYSNDKHGCRVV